MKKVTIETEYIKLDSLLKLAGEVSTGGEAKEPIRSGQCRINAEVCTERGHKCRPGDIISFRGTEIAVE